MEEIVITINGLGEVVFYTIPESEVEDFINEKCDEGYLVSVVTNCNKVLRNGMIDICYTVKRKD